MTDNPMPPHDSVDDLETWVGWLLARYRLDTRWIPTCWQRHGEHLDELTALHAAWLHAHSPEARPDAPLHWHEAFHLTRARLREASSYLGCSRSTGTHCDE